MPISTKKIVLVNPRYPFGKDQIFLGGSIVSIGARLMAMGHEVELIDLNIDRINSGKIQERLRGADVIGLSLTGSAHIPGAIHLAATLHQMNAKANILVGGQVIERLQSEQFRRLFGEGIMQVSSEIDLAHSLGCEVTDIPIPEAVAYAPVWQQMGEKRLAQYLRTEATLVVSQGCHFGCEFCAARKEMKEVFWDIKHFEDDLCYLTDVAKRNGIAKLEFYASSLDFFQNPGTVRQYLEVLARVQKESEVVIRVRCLSCLTSFLHAAEAIPDFGDLLKRAGLWCVGFGADGTSEVIWRAQRKGHNNTSDMLRCLELCKQFAVRAELLMVFGFSQDTAQTLRKTVLTSLLAVASWPDIIIRPYLAKQAVPGNKGWQTKAEAVEAIMTDPQKFYNLDFCAIGSPLTHPNWQHRWMCNAAYLTICTLLTPFGKCTTSPLLPQGEGGMYGFVARLVNRLMPFDR